MRNLVPFLQSMRLSPLNLDPEFLEKLKQLLISNIDTYRIELSNPENDAIVCEVCHNTGHSNEVCDVKKTREGVDITRTPEVQQRQETARKNFKKQGIIQMINQIITSLTEGNFEGMILDNSISVKSVITLILQFVQSRPANEHNKFNFQNAFYTDLIKVSYDNRVSIHRGARLFTSKLFLKYIETSLKNISKKVMCEDKRNIIEKTANCDNPYKDLIMFMESIYDHAFFTEYWFRNIAKTIINARNSADDNIRALQQSYIAFMTDKVNRLIYASRDRPTQIERIQHDAMSDEFADLFNDLLVLAGGKFKKMKRSKKTMLNRKSKKIMLNRKSKKIMLNRKSKKTIFTRTSRKQY